MQELSQRRKTLKQKSNIILTQTNIGELHDSIMDRLLTEAADFQEKESSWTLSSILYLGGKFNKFDPLHASSFIDIPAITKKKETYCDKCLETMNQALPLNGFKWVDLLDMDHIAENDDKGYILEVDLKYP
ncbi:hypothetical protein NPIL_455271 [Nephila pilipes]|uniref:Uncharacterized protein n=1 Tax=Nephila pilipes TaxID=299642 RepID=A0A8X6UI76_NEPPI|nr:hypothetical protein NPIL_455271 [Nephila pilipes]